MAILNGVPGFYLDDQQGIEGLQEEAFEEGQPTVPNSDNKWALFVYEATSKCADTVTAWEIGNEPPQEEFPLGSDHYIDALRTACQVIEVTDPDAIVLLASPYTGEALATPDGGGDWLPVLAENPRPSFEGQWQQPLPRFCQLYL